MPEETSSVPLVPTAMREASVPMSAEDTLSAMTTGRGSKKGWVYLPGALLVLFKSTRPSPARAAGEERRKRAAAAPAALEDRVLSRDDETIVPERRGRGRVLSAKSDAFRSEIQTSGHNPANTTFFTAMCASPGDREAVPGGTKTRENTNIFGTPFQQKKALEMIRKPIER